jgi:hypothetical protein
LQFLPTPRTLAELRAVIRQLQEGELPAARKDAVTPALRTALKAHPTGAVAAINAMRRALTRLGAPAAEAKRVAVTEVRAAINALLHQYASRYAKERGVTLLKHWRHNDKLVESPRCNHKALHGTSVGIDDPFTLVGADGAVYKPQYPHDGVLPAGEVINCQCSYDIVRARKPKAAPRTRVLEALARDLTLWKARVHKYIRREGKPGDYTYYYADDEGKSAEDGDPPNAEAQESQKESFQKQKERVIENLDKMAVPMMSVAYSKDEYNRLFPKGTVETPIGTVKMGVDQFAKLGRRDDGKRQSYIGAAFQTLTDPVVILQEDTDDIYIKSFINENGVSTFMSVEKDQADGRFVVTNYLRHKKEVIKKIKKVDSIVYIKDDRGNPARMSKEGVPHADGSHTDTVSHKTEKESSRAVKKAREAVLKALAHDLEILKNAASARTPIRKAGDHKYIWREGEPGDYTYYYADDGNDDGQEPEAQKPADQNKNLQTRLKSKFDKLAVPMQRYEFSKESYDMLFPKGEIKTPIGVVKMGRGQYDKLVAKGRETLLGGVYQTLKEPICIIQEQRGYENLAELYVKSFKKSEREGIDTLISVVIEKEGAKISISTHKRDANNILNKIKSSDDILYESGGALSEGRTDRATGDNEVKPLADNDDNHLNIVSHKTEKESSRTVKKTREAVLKALAHDLEILKNAASARTPIRKARDHKYIWREGDPGDYTYYYADDEGKSAKPQESEDDKGSAGKRPPTLKDNIHAILHGTNGEKEKVKGQYFHLADTPDFMKESPINLTGDYFTAGYGMISRHKDKDADHALSEENWAELCDEITKPFAIAKRKDGFRLFTNVKVNGRFTVVGVNVKNAGRNLEINAIKTAFGYDEQKHSHENILYRSPKMTPEQTALLEGLNSHSLPSVQATDTVSHKREEESRGKIKKTREIILEALAHDLTLWKARAHKYIRREGKSGDYTYLYADDGNAGGSGDKYENDKKKPADRILNKDELKNFIDRALNTKENEKAKIGVVNEKTRGRIKGICGEEVSHIEADMEHIRHALNKPAHNLESSDILLSEEAINNAQEIRLIDDLNKGSKMLEFKTDIDGVIYFIEGVHKKGDGFLSLIICYRQKKKRGLGGAPLKLKKSLQEHTSETWPPPASSIISSNSTEKSRGEVTKAMTWEIILKGLAHDLEVWKRRRYAVGGERELRERKRGI